MLKIAHMTIRVLIVDDHEMLRNGLRAILESQDGFMVCGEAKNGAEAIEKTEALDPDVVILDITMPTMDGFEAARKIRQSHPDTPILILTMHSSKEFIGVLRKIGASGYISKSESATTLLAAILKVHQKQTFFPVEL